MAIKKSIQADLKQLRHQRHQLADQTLVKTADGIVESIGIALPVAAIGEFRTDQKNEQWNNVYNDFFHDAYRQAAYA